MASPRTALSTKIKLTGSETKTVAKTFGKVQASFPTVIKTDFATPAGKGNIFTPATVSLPPMATASGHITDRTQPSRSKVIPLGNRLVGKEV